MKSNEKLQKDVQDAIKWEPLLHAAEIGVIVHDGIVTLTGTVDSYAKKTEAEQAAKSVAGVKAVVDDIEVRFANGFVISDTDIAESVVLALKGNWSVPDSKIKTTVDNGWVTLEGTLHWDFQRQAARNAVRYLAGVRGVTNKLMIKSEVEDQIEQKKVEDALRRNWAIDSDKIHVRAHGTTISLSGIVSSLFQKDEAERIAYKTPGVWFVDNQLVVEYDYLYA
ncbi:ornithine aminotransferase [Flavobacterium album]|uniref:Ornithine aminotransferase n=1 Tax=Flavobacterium album TaxID=2175091 RepID=A0A2S1R167_9FLAO|nr:BON domain-containing protein [Flavobacterium album]AWH86385.1 ornithine aminotransferase [Flavobacterium album]